MGTERRAAYLPQLSADPKSLVRSAQIFTCLLLAIISCIRLLLSLTVPGISNSKIPPLVWLQLTSISLLFPILSLKLYPSISVYFGFFNINFGPTWFFLFTTSIFTTVDAAGTSTWFHLGISGLSLVLSVLDVALHHVFATQILKSIRMVSNEVCGVSSNTYANGSTPEEGTPNSDAVHVSNLHAVPKSSPLVTRSSGPKSLVALIDADDTLVRDFDSLLSEISEYGSLSVIHVYGNALHSLSDWNLNACCEVRIHEKMRPTGSTTTLDMAIVIDAIHLYHTQQPDGFVIVSTNCDFTALAHRLRREGLFVIGFGGTIPSYALQNACDHFVRLKDVCASSEGAVKVVELPATVISASGDFNRLGQNECHSQYITEEEESKDIGAVALWVSQSATHARPIDAPTIAEPYADQTEWEQGRPSENDKSWTIQEPKAIDTVRQTDYDHPVDLDKSLKKKARRIIFSALQQIDSGSEWIEMGTLGSIIWQMNPDLRFSEFGCVKLTQLLKATTSLETRIIGSRTEIRKPKFFLSTQRKEFTPVETELSGHRPSPTKDSVKSSDVRASEADESMNSTKKMNKKARNLMFAALSEIERGTGWADINELGTVIQRIRPKMKLTDYGCSTLSELVKDVAHWDTRVIEGQLRVRVPKFTKST